MKKLGFIFVLSLAVLFSGCKKDEGLSDADKSKFIKTYGTLAEGCDMKQTADGGYIMLGVATAQNSNDIYLKKVDAFGIPQWSKTYDGPLGRDEKAGSIIVLSNGGFAIVGTAVATDDDSTSSDEVSSTFLLITDNSGNKINSETYNSYADSGKVEHENGYGLFETAAGSILVVSERDVIIDNIPIKVGVTRSIDPTTLDVQNELIALATPEGSNRYNLGLRDVLVTNSGHFVSTGYSTKTGTLGSKGSSISLGLLQTDSSGTPSWRADLAYGTLFDDSSNALIENSQGDVLFVGSTRLNGNSDFYVMHFDDDQFDRDVTGTPIPTWEYISTSTAQEEAFDIVEVPGGYVIAGYTETVDDRQMYLEKINSDGSAMLWNKDYGFVNFDEAKAIVATSDNGLAIMGTTSDERGNRVMTLLKLDANGNLK